MSCDLILDEDHSIHISILPRLGLIIINELEDFGEHWIEVKIVESTRERLTFDVKTLSGHNSDGTLHAACRYFVDTIYNNLHKKSGPSPEQIGSLLKFVVNINLRQEILTNRANIMSLGDALGDLVSCCC